MTKHSILFVCLGNICRSPMAEIVFREMIRERGLANEWEIDSAGTCSYHVSQSPDERSVETCKRLIGPQMTPVTHTARQVKDADFRHYEYMFCMDKSNLHDLMKVSPSNATVEPQLLGSWDPKGKKEVDDPYYGSHDGFRVNFEHITRCCNALLDDIYK